MFLDPLCQINIHLPLTPTDFFLTEYRAWLLEGLRTDIDALEGDDVPPEDKIRGVEIVGYNVVAKEASEHSMLIRDWHIFLVVSRSIQEKNAYSISDGPDANEGWYRKVSAELEAAGAFVELGEELDRRAGIALELFKQAAAALGL